MDVGGREVRGLGEGRLIGGVVGGDLTTAFLQGLLLLHVSQHCAPVPASPAAGLQAPGEGGAAGWWGEREEEEMRSGVGVEGWIKKFMSERSE